MEKDKYANAYDIRWREVYYEAKDELSSEQAPESYGSGEIKFRKNKRKSKFKGFFKGVAFILIASISGAISAAYIVQKKYAVLDPSNQQGKYTIPDVTYGTNVLPLSPTTRVAELVAPSVVGISNKAENFLARSDTKFSGTGVIFDNKEGYIVTNYHIIEGIDKIVVKLASENSKPLSAVLKGFDKVSDIAVLKVDAENLPAARLGDSTKLRAGDTVVAIGNPFGEEFIGNIDDGIISSTNRRIESTDIANGEKVAYKVLQTSAHISDDNSGGPLCNQYGEVIGINSVKIGTRMNTEGMGYAVPIKEVKDIITSIIRNGEVVKPSLGIRCGTLGENAYGLQGVYVNGVYPGSGAWDAGIKTWDVIIELDNIKITKYEDYLAVIEKHKIDDTINCKFVRNGKTIETKVTLKKSN